MQLQQDMDQFAAARRGSLLWFKRHMRYKYVVDKKGEYGLTSLMIASLNGREEICKLLLSAGASIDKQDEYGWTSLMIASRYGHKEVCKVLLSHGASLVGGRYVYGWTSTMKKFHKEILATRKTFAQTPRTLKYYVLKLQPHTNYKLLLTRNTYEREVACF